MVSGSVAHEKTQLFARRCDMYLLDLSAAGQYPRYEWGQPPCSMYQKIIAEHNYTSVMVVEKGRNPAGKQDWK